MDESPKTERLAEFLKALGNPNRLALLHALREPRMVSDLELHPESVKEGENPQRPISHQAVREHLAKLREIGVVAVQRTERNGSIVDEYVLNHQQLFAIVEELRQLGELRAEEQWAPLPTIAAARPTPEVRDTGPRFILVRGQGEGQVFPLRKETLSADRGWILGRKRGLAVSLDYDPFCSSENAEVLLNGAGFSLLDIRSSRNGTMLNFKALPRGGTAPLANGDIVTVGRTNLVFRVG